MAKKRSREEPSQPETGETAAAGTNEAAPANGDRRNGMADVARRRAAHFAHFDDEDDAVEDNVHVGSDKARTLGPWSSAMELVNAREKAQQDRQARLQEAAPAEQEALSEAAGWVPRRDPALGPHLVDPVAPLFSLCLDVLTEWVECVESLEGVPDVIKVRLAAHVCARRKMSPEVSRLFGAGGPSELVLPDCTQLDATAMRELVGEVATGKLQRLELGFCG
ncbi:hypothetical protein Agub_g543, partial [Astrephomene gubernaculifera]